MRHGGEERLWRLVAGTYKINGAVLVGDAEVPFTGSLTYQLPKKFREETRFEVDSVETRSVTIIDGDKVTVLANGRPREVDEAERRERLDEAVFHDANQITPLLDRSRFRLVMGKDAVVDGKPASVVVVSGKGFRGATFFSTRRRGSWCRPAARRSTMASSPSSS